MINKDNRYNLLPKIKRYWHTYQDILVILGVIFLIARIITEWRPDFFIGADILAVVFQVHATIFAIAISLYLIFLSINRNSLAGMMIKKMLHPQGRIFRGVLVNFIAFLDIAFVYVIVKKFPEVNGFLLPLGLFSFLFFIYALFELFRILQLTFRTIDEGKWAYIEERIATPVPLMGSDFDPEERRSLTIITHEYINWSQGLIEMVKDADVMGIKYFFSHLSQRMQHLIKKQKADADAIQKLLDQWIELIKDIYILARTSGYDFVIMEILNFIAIVHRYCSEEKVYYTAFEKMDELLEQIAFDAINAGVNNIADEALTVIWVSWSKHLEKNLPEAASIHKMDGGTLDDMEAQTDKQRQDSYHWRYFSDDLLRKVTAMLEDAINVNNHRIVNEHIGIFDTILRAVVTSKMAPSMKHYMGSWLYFHATEVSRKTLLHGMWSKLKLPSIFHPFSIESFLKKEKIRSDAIFRYTSQWGLDVLKAGYMDEHILNEFGALGRGLTRVTSANKYTKGIIDMFLQMKEHLDLSEYHSAKLYLELKQQTQSIEEWSKQEDTNNKEMQEYAAKALEKYIGVSQAKTTIRKNEIHLPDKDDK